MKCQLALFSAYRIDQYADADGFKNSLGAVLEGFPDEVIRYVCDPRTGLQRRMKWPPTISEVVDACEEHQEHLSRQRVRPRQALPKPFERPQAKSEDVFVARDHPGYERLTTRIKLRSCSVDGREGVMAPPEILVELGLMKRSFMRSA